MELDDGFGDGWYLGRHVTGGGTGLFPGGKSGHPAIEEQKLNETKYTPQKYRLGLDDNQLLPQPFEPHCLHKQRCLNRPYWLRTAIPCAPRQRINLTSRVLQVRPRHRCQNLSANRSRHPAFQTLQSLYLRLLHHTNLILDFLGA